MLAECPDRAFAVAIGAHGLRIELAVERARITIHLAFLRDQCVGWKFLAALAGDKDFAFGDDRGCKVED